MKRKLALLFFMLAFPAVAQIQGGGSAPAPPASPGVPGLMFPTPSPTTLQSGVYPPSVLKAAIAQVEAGGTVNVCLAGDSTALGTPAGVNEIEGLQYQIQHWMTVRNPGVKFTFDNFAVPGTTFADYVTDQGYSLAAAYGISWYTGSTTVWSQYVNAADCQIVFLDFGVNDSYNTSPATFRNVIQNTLQISGTDTPPGIVFVTNAIANPSVGVPFSTAAYQDGYLSTPSLERAIVGLGAAGFSTPPSNLMAGQTLGIIDINRLFQQTVTGKDYEDQTSYNELSLLPTPSVSLSSTTPYTLPQTDGDFDVAFSVASALPAMNGINDIYVTLGSMDGGAGSTSIAAEIEPSTGGGYISILDGGDVAFSMSKAWSGTALAIEVAKKGALISVTVNGQTITSDYIMPRAPFTPEILLTGAGTYGATITKWAPAVHRTYNPILSAAEAWGPITYSSLAAQATASGGNAVYLTLPISANVSVGQPIIDNTVISAIPASTTITAVNASTGAVTISNDVAAIGVAVGDAIAVGPSTSITGGNGINHDASDALNLIYQRAVEATNLCLVCYTESGPFQSRATVITTGGTTYTSAYGLKHLTQNPAATLATHTTALPPNPYDGQTFEDASTQAITAETVTAGAAPAGTAIVGGTQPYAISLGNALNFRYYQALNEWIEGASP